MSSDASRDELHAMSLGASGGMGGGGGGGSVLSAGDSSSGGAASPLTARSLRLERVAQALAHSQEELRR